MKYALLWVAFTLAVFGSVAGAQEQEQPTILAATTQTTLGDSPAIVKTEFIFEHAPFPSCHASTIAETKTGLVAAWFGGTRERAPDVGIWVSRQDGQGWSVPVEVANGIQPTGPRMPTWNPVLFQAPDGPLLLFYKVGPAPAKWWGMLTTSTDGGASWSVPRRLPDGILGPVKDKPVLLPTGLLLCPSSTEGDGSKVHIEFTSDLGATWTKTDDLNDGHEISIIQPTLLNHGDGNLQILCRSHDKKIFQSWSADNGKTWQKPSATDLPNPNSGIDAVQLADGRSLLVYNHSPTDRHPLNVAISPDGKTWQPPLLIENTTGPQLSYPAVIQTRDGLVHITYTWERKRIRHVVLDPSKIQ